MAPAQAPRPPRGARSGADPDLHHPERAEIRARRLTRADRVEDYRRAVEGRVAALARAHALLAGNDWSGTELRAILEGELAAFPSEGQGAPRAEIAGPPCELPATAAQPLAMSIHELATNAVKHGALSAPGGRVSVSWEVDREAGLLRLNL